MKSAPAFDLTSVVRAIVIACVLSLAAFGVATSNDDGHAPTHRSMHP